MFFVALTWETMIPSHVFFSSFKFVETGLENFDSTFGRHCAILHASSWNWDVKYEEWFAVRESRANGKRQNMRGRDMAQWSYLWHK